MCTVKDMSVAKKNFDKLDVKIEFVSEGRYDQNHYLYLHTKQELLTKVGEKLYIHSNSLSDADLNKALNDRGKRVFRLLKDMPGFIEVSIEKYTMCVQYGAAFSKKEIMDSTFEIFRKMLP